MTPPKKPKNYTENETNRRQEVSTKDTGYLPYRAWQRQGILHRLSPPLRLVETARIGENTIRLSYVPA